LGKLQREPRLGVVFLFKSPQGLALLADIISAVEVPFQLNEVKMTDQEMVIKYGWASQAKVGGYLNIEEAPEEILTKFLQAIGYGMSAWPEGYDSMPTDKEGLKNFAKAAKATAKTLWGVISIPFGMPSYKEGGQYLKDQGLVQYHTSVSINDIDYAVHWWGINDPEHGYRQEDGAVSWRLAKVKIDTGEQLNGILNP
jgi:hypothetical protein